MGIDGLKENGIKISNTLKGRVASWNIINNTKTVTDITEYNEKWYIVGRTAKNIQFFEYRNKLYTKHDLLKYKNINILDYKGMRTNKPYKNVSVKIVDILENFEYYSSIIFTNS